jgi:general secretion pathway protein G
MGAHPGRARGFTLMELVVTLALLGLLAMVAAPLAELTVQRQREQALRLALHDIRDAIDRYKAAADRGDIARRIGDSGYPPNLGVLVEGVIHQRSPKGERLYFLRQLPRDPMAPPSVEAEQSWALRAYSSPPDAPSPGSDVYDVHSRARGTGINGVPYAQW